jgi:hypothetical protein
MPSGFAHQWETLDIDKIGVLTVNPNDAFCAGRKLQLNHNMYVIETARIRI